MSAPKTRESELLAISERALHDAVGLLNRDHFELRLQVLEAAAASFGGFELTTFHRAFATSSVLAPVELQRRAVPVVEAIRSSGIPAALALSALARETLADHDRKNTGSYHTDFRLARRLASIVAARLPEQGVVIDPACGAGILLAAVATAICGADKPKAANFLSRAVCAADRSPNALRAALLSLASLTDDVSALRAMRRRWMCGDSLLASAGQWESMAPGGFDAVVANPPWEKIKLTRHEFLKSSGQDRHYGAQVDALDVERFATQRHEVASYSRQLAMRYPSLATGEPDLYIAFTDLFLRLCKPSGVIAALVPGGLIRSQGTRGVRTSLFEECDSIRLSVLDNKARFFSIDTRFKFLVVELSKRGVRSRVPAYIELLHERGTENGLEKLGEAKIEINVLRETRQDLSIPEVRSPEEWDLFQRISLAGCSWTESGAGWNPKFCREVDMTKERPRFQTNARSNSIPVIEGRMVQAHRFGVKGFVSGSGRRAVWDAYPVGASRLSPQFWIAPEHVPPANRGRTNELRAGFCDIAGQTNERSLMAALVPPGVVCGNKVPTIQFPEDPSEERLLVWIAIANSFVFDWMLRRVLTTTVNYFLLQSVPLPRLAKGGLPWKRLAAASSELHELDRAGASRETQDRVVQLRSEIDAEICVAYGLTLPDMELILDDFPILDRGQPPFPGEARSTVTRDTVLAAVARRTKVSNGPWNKRLEVARAIGACAYIPSEIALRDEGVDSEGALGRG